MHSNIKYLIAGFIFSVFSCQVMAEPQQSLQQVIQNSLPAIVNIQAEHPVDLKKLAKAESMPMPNLPDDLVPKDGAIGSGVIISKKNGIILTNNHVVDKATAVIVTLNDGERVLAKVIGKDKDYDIAVLAIDMRHVNAKSLSELELGDSQKLQVGQEVIAIGSPYGLSQSVSTGIVSALNRSPGDLVPYASFIQTDAPINPGNSGGALIDASGKLIGINTAILSPTHSSAGIGFAIPSNLAGAVALQILKTGKVNHGVLGVMAQNLTPELRAAFAYNGKDGVLVTSVLPNTPAAKANIRGEDIIIAINNTPLDDTKSLQDSVRLYAPGTKIALQVWREKKEQNINVVVGDPKNIPVVGDGYLSGLRLQNITEEDPDGTYNPGVLVLGLKDISAGNVGGLAQGDIILEANHKATPDIKSLKIISAAQKQQGLLVKVRRADGNIYLVIPNLG
jgi:serine protease Do